MKKIVLCFFLLGIFCFSQRSNVEILEELKNQKIDDVYNDIKNDSGIELISYSAGKEISFILKRDKFALQTVCNNSYVSYIYSFYGNSENCKIVWNGFIHNLTNNKNYTIIDGSASSFNLNVRNNKTDFDSKWTLAQDYSGFLITAYK